MTACSLLLATFKIIFDLINIAFLSQEIISVLQKLAPRHLILSPQARTDHLCSLNLVFSCLFFFQCWGSSPTPVFTIPHSTPESYPLTFLKFRRQGLSIKPWLACNSQLFCLMSAGVTGLCDHPNFSGVCKKIVRTGVSRTQNLTDPVSVTLYLSSSWCLLSTHELSRKPVCRQDEAALPRQYSRTENQSSEARSPGAGVD